MIANPFDDFVSVDQAVMKRESTGDAKVGHLLWGDGVHVTGPAQNGRLPVHARGRTRNGWVDVDELGGSPLLEVYFIDVGQGDGMLVRTPDFRHVMIDGAIRDNHSRAGRTLPTLSTGNSSRTTVWIGSTSMR